MTDVVVHRCVLQVRRSRGWGWGASPDALLAAATRTLPSLIGARLPAIAERLASSAHVVQPVEVRIAMSVSQLAALADRDAASPAAAELRDRIAGAVAAAVERAIERDAFAGRAGAPAAHREDERARASERAGTADDLAGRRAAEHTAPELDPAGQLAPAFAGDAHHAAARRAVRTWWRTGALAGVLDRIEHGALVWLHDLLLDDSARSAIPGPELVAAAARAAQQVAGWPAGPQRSLRRRIAIAAGLLDAMPSVAAAPLRAAVDRIAPRAPRADELRAGGDPDAAADRRDAIDPPPTASAPGHPGDRNAAALVEPRPEHARASSAPAIVAPAATADIEVRSVLPFLLLAPLHHAGWLDEAATLLTAHRCEPAAFALAAGLAAQVLDPVDRGWKRSGPDRVALAAFAGRTALISDAEVRAAAAELHPMLGALDAGLRALLARARKPWPQVLWRDARGWLLVDTDGMVALAAAADLRGVLAAAHAAPVIVPAACADAATFDQLDYANLPFISDAPPTRGEVWRSFAGTTRRLYTNDTATPDGQLVAATADLDHTLALVAELAELVAARPVIPRDPVTAFEATCTLAATAALADIAARLFPAERATPALVLARFRDLDARVAFDADRISVRFPLGRRHADLLRHGLVGEFAGIPWLGGRTLDLAGG